IPGSFEVGSESNGIQNIYDRRAERALSGNNVPHRLSISSLYELPAGKGKRWMSSGAGAAVLGGWSVALIGIFQHGSTMELVTQTNTTNAFTPGAQRVNVLRDPNLPPDQRSVAHWFDVTAVAAPSSLTFGNSGRALVNTAGLTNVSISLLKNIRLRERYNVQFRMEAL